jgi:hypothetical protein
MRCTAILSTLLLTLSFGGGCRKERKQPSEKTGAPAHPGGGSGGGTEMSHDAGTHRAPGSPGAPAPTGPDYGAPSGAPSMPHPGAMPPSQRGGGGGGGTEPGRGPSEDNP